MSARKLRDRVLAVLLERGPISANALVAIVRSRRADVLAAVRALEAAGRVRRTPDGLEAAESAGNHRGTTSRVDFDVSRDQKTTENGFPARSRPGSPNFSTQPEVSSPDSGLTAAALDRMARPDRIAAIWNALSPAGRERAWAALNGDQRLDALAILFDAEELDGEPPPIFTSAFDAWQRGAER